MIAGLPTGLHEKPVFLKKTGFWFRAVTYYARPEFRLAPQPGMEYRVNK